jgi:glycerol-3-phosphate acyltransferase PlsX
MQNKTTNNQDYHRPRIGVDLLGCDTPAKKILEAIAEHEWEGKHPPRLTLFGTEEVFASTSVPEGIECCVVSEEITMEDDPLLAVRRKKQSSMAIGLQTLKNYDIDAFISGGNSGALLAQTKITLNMLPGIDRPALLTLIPSKLEPIAVLDVGANLELTPENYLQFAKMGIAFQKARGLEHPVVGLLNIGEEKKKGTPKHQKAYSILQTLNDASPINAPTFIGNIEGRDVFLGNIDVLITDGFTGNVFLKTSEGIAGFVLEQMENLGPIGAIPGIRAIVATLKNRLSYAEYPGAILCGADGVVIKCHGASPPETFVGSIVSTSRLVSHGFVEKIKAELNP